MLDAEPDAEGFCLHRDTSLVQHLKRVARAVADRQNDVIGVDAFATFQPHATHSPRAIDPNRDIEPGDLGLKAVFAAERLDAGAYALYN